ncbi:MAG: M23 family metallopeptidase [Treponema sp.]|nr:M23 family metallopeptidase [Treponema sp.]
MNKITYYLLFCVFTLLTACGSSASVQSDLLTSDPDEFLHQDSFSFPISGQIITPHGWSVDPITGNEKYHQGIDIASEIGTPIKAASSGIVIVINLSQTLGGFVVIRHYDSIHTIYGNLGSFSVSKGDLIAKGSLLGTVGGNRHSSEPHLHFSMHKDGIAVDPLEYLDTP